MFNLRSVCASLAVAAGLLLWSGDSFGDSCLDDESGSEKPESVEGQFRNPNAPKDMTVAQKAAGWKSAGWFQFQNEGPAFRMASLAMEARRNLIARRADADESGHVYTTDSGIPTTCEGVVVGSGNKIHTETDFASEGEAGLSLTRTYNKSRPEVGVFGSHWFSTADYKLILIGPEFDCSPFDPDIDYTQIPRCSYVEGTRPGRIMLFKPTGATYTFMWRDDLGRWANDWDNPTAFIDEVRSTPLGPTDPWTKPDKWVHTTEIDGVETYTPAGLVASILNKHGVGWFYEYDTANPTRLKYIRHSSDPSPNGRYIEFFWNGSGRVSSVRDPDGKVFNYAYTAAGYLSGVTFPDSTGSRTYHYELAGYPHALTGVTIDNGRYSTFTYYSHTGPNRGRVASSELAGGINRQTFVYSPEDNDPNTLDPLRVEVTNVNGVTYKYEYGWATLDNRVLIATSSVNGPQNADACPSTDKATTYASGGYNVAYPDVVTDWSGNQTDYDYNTKGQVTQVIYGKNGPQSEWRSVQVFWKTDHNAIDRELYYAGDPATGTLLKEVSYQYYGASQPARFRLQSVTTTDWHPDTPAANRTRVTNYAYDFHPDTTFNGMLAKGALKSMTVDGPIPGTVDRVASEYNAKGDLLWVENNAGDRTTFGGHNGRGQPTTVQSPNDLVATTTIYDARGRVASTTHQANGAPVTTAFQYDRFGTVISQTINGVQVLYRTTGPTGLIGSERWQYGDSEILLYEYNNLGLKFKESVTGIEYVSSGNCGTLGEPEPCPPQPTVVVKYSKTWERDSIGRVTAEKGNNQQNVRFEYDGEGNVTKLTDSLGRYTTYLYNAFGEQTRMTQPSGESGGPLTVTETGYDALGRVAWLKDPKNQTTHYNVNGHGDLLDLSSPDTGTTSYQHDVAGRVTQTDRANGDLVTYDYTDSLGRLHQVTATNAQGSNTELFEYDFCDFGKGHTCKVTDASGSTEYDYNDQGLIASQVNTVAGQSYTIASAYDHRGRLTGVAYGGNEVLYEYGVLSRPYVTAVKVRIGSANPVPVISNIAYMPRGPVESWTYGNNAIRTMTYDLDYRLKKIATTSIQSLTYTLNAANEITGIANGLQSAATQTYAYDSLSRVKGVTKTGSGGNEAFTFDANGNRLTHTKGGATDTYHPEPLSNRIPSITGGTPKAMVHDDIGNITQATTGTQTPYTYAHDPFNRVKSITKDGQTTTYDYDASNQRVRKAGATPDIRYLWAGGQLLAETGAGNPTFSTFYIRLGGELIGLIKGGALYYVHSDHLGRPEVVTDSAANNKAQRWRARNYTYDREVITTSSQVPSLNLGFPGQYFDAESGLWYNLNRYYDAATGRYVSSDPVGLQGGSNTYAYVSNRPTSAIDPFGLLGILLTGPQRGMPTQTAVDISRGGTGVFAGSLEVSGTAAAAVVGITGAARVGVSAEGVKTTVNAIGCVLDIWAALAGPGPDGGYTPNEASEALGGRQAQIEVLVPEKIGRTRPPKGKGCKKK